MINVQVFTCNMLQENCFIVSDETKECAIIDCGAFYQEERDMIIDYIKKNQLIPTTLEIVACKKNLDSLPRYTIKTSS